MARRVRTHVRSATSRRWAGIDVRKGHHHGLALDVDGKNLLSRRVANYEPELLLALLVSHGQKVLNMPGRLVSRASDGYRGQGNSAARDAYVIADQARRRRDLLPIRPGDEAEGPLALLALDRHTPTDG